MVSWPEVIIAVFLAYYWTGVDMVLFHSGLDPLDQPAYASARGLVLKMIGAGIVWPVVAYFNREFAWFTTTFVSSAVVLGAAYIGLHDLIGSTFLAVLILGALRWTPVISKVIILPLALLSGLLWFLVARPLGGRVPTGVERSNR